MGAYSRALLLAATLCIAAVRAVSLAAPHALHALRPALRGGAPVNGDASDSSGSPGREAGLSCSASHPRVAIQLTESDTILRGGGGVSSSSTPPSEALHLSESDHALGREGLSACEATPHRSKPGDEHTAAAPRKRGLLWGLARRTTRAALWLSRSCYP
ncbi:hypothetical protein T484DRAFT_1838677 [Baffinella frigidus]|jgi:hypothetical protein|nr:hypothetical protein T484DRAFT_1838677 [Cryptophyta sp. CCMP2293]